MTQQNSSWVVDTCALIDGHVLALADCGLVRRAYVSERVLAELERLAVSTDRAGAGRRGLVAFAELWRRLGPALVRLGRCCEGGGLDVDSELLEWAFQLEAWLLTADRALQQRAAARGVAVMNVRDFYAPLLPGDELSVVVTGTGRRENQGTASLADGTLVVVRDGRRHLGHHVQGRVTAVLYKDHQQTVFADPVEGKDDEAPFPLDAPVLAAQTAGAGCSVCH